MAVTLIPFFSSLAGAEASAAILARLAASGAQVTSAAEFLKKGPKPFPLLVANHEYIFVGTGGTEKSIADFVCRARLRPPIILLSHEASNALPAAMEIRTFLQQRGVTARIVHAPLDGLVERIRGWCAFARVEERLRASRLGVVGEPSAWLVASRVSAARVRRRWGLTIERYPLAAVGDLLHEALGPDFKARLEQFARQATALSVSRAELVRAGVVAQGLVRFAQTHKLDAVTVACFSLLEGTGVSGCFGLSCLNDWEGMVAGCEGDVPTTFTMLVAKLLTGQPGFMANVSDVDLDANSATFAHCTVATTLVERYEVTTHYESGKSVAIRGRFRPQSATVLKVFGDDLSRYWVSSGAIISHEPAASGCRTQVRVKLSEPVSYFLDRSLANHHVIVPGDHSRVLRDFFAFALRE